MPSATIQKGKKKSVAGPAHGARRRFDDFLPQLLCMYVKGKYEEVRSATELAEDSRECQKISESRDPARVCAPLEVPDAKFEVRVSKSVRMRDVAKIKIGQGRERKFVLRDSMRVQAAQIWPKIEEFLSNELRA